MTPNEALLLFELSYQDTPEFAEALSVLRAVVEDYEAARPLLEEIHKAEVGNYWTENSDATGKAEFTFYDDRPIVLAAIAYREGRKP